MSAQIDPRAFRQVLGQFCTGITIITTVHDEVPAGFACQSFAALSLLHFMRLAPTAPSCTKAPKIQNVEIAGLAFARKPHDR